MSASNGYHAANSDARRCSSGEWIAEKEIVLADENPVAYPADVLLRVQAHPASRIDELLPHNWSPPHPSRRPEAGRRRTQAKRGDSRTR
jgi:hypothetical protein